MWWEGRDSGHAPGSRRGCRHDGPIGANLLSAQAIPTPRQRGQPGSVCTGEQAVRCEGLCVMHACVRSRRGRDPHVPRQITAFQTGSGGGPRKSVVRRGIACGLRRFTGMFPSGTSACAETPRERGHTGRHVACRPIPRVARGLLSRPASLDIMSGASPSSCRGVRSSPCLRVLVCTQARVRFGVTCRCCRLSPDTTSSSF